MEHPLKEIAFKTASRESQTRYKRAGDERAKIEMLRAMAINTLVHAAVEVFSNHSNKILNGEFADSLLSKVPYRKQIKVIEKLSSEKVYATRPVAQIETAGFEVLGGLLDRVVPVLTRDSEKLSPGEKKLLQLIPPQFTDGPTNIARLHNATDFVAGMTDSYAVTLYRCLRGIELPRGS